MGLSSSFTLGKTFPFLCLFFEIHLVTPHMITDCSLALCLQLSGSTPNFKAVETRSLRLLPQLYYLTCMDVPEDHDLTFQDGPQTIKCGFPRWVRIESLANCRISKVQIRGYPEGMAYACKGPGITGGGSLDRPPARLRFLTI